MDVLAHTLWTNVVFYTKYANERGQRYIAAFFGVMPDLVSFTPVFIYTLFHRISFNKDVFKFPDSWTYQYAVQSYNFSHSLVIFAVVLLIVTVVRKGKIYWPLFGWMLHILIDIPTHEIKFFPTPFLYPLSNVHNPYAVSWGHPLFMVINYAALAVVYIIIFTWRNKRMKKDATVQ